VLFGGCEEAVERRQRRAAALHEDAGAAVRRGRDRLDGKTCAKLLERPRDWFLGRNMFDEIPELAPDWRDILHTVAETRETYLDRTYRGLLNLPRKGEEWVWNVLAFPITLHTRATGVVLSARILERKTVL